MRTALFWAITQRVVVIPYRRFGTTYLSHIQGSVPFLRVILEVGSIAFPETSVRNCVTAQQGVVLICFAAEA
jgi:hypothetical protein